MSSSTTTAANGTSPNSTSNGLSESGVGGGGQSSPTVSSSPSSSGMPPPGGGGGGDAGAGSGEDRLRELEAVFSGGPESAHEAKAFSTETLLDILLILYNECCNSSLRKEKTVTDFIELGE